MISMLIISCLLAFQEEEIQISEEFKFQYVQLDVAAFDRNGNPVTDLKPTDFVIKENRKKIKLDSFRILDYDKQTAVSLNMETLNPIPGEQDEEPETELISQYILALDFSSARLMEIRRTFSEVEKFLDGFEPERKFQIMIYSIEHGDATSVFHNNIEDVKKALEKYKTKYLGEKANQQIVGSNAKYHQPDDRGYFNQGSNKGYGKLNRDIDELEMKLRQCRTLHDPKTVEEALELNICIDNELEAYLAIQEDRVARTLGGLETLVNDFRNVDGMKTMLFISPGFSITPGQSGLLLAEHYRNFATSEIDTTNRRNFNEDVQFQMGQMTSHSVPRSRTFEDEFRAVVHACTRNRVVFHAFDLFNFQREADRSGDLFHQSGKPTKLQLEAHRQYGAEMQEGLHRLAKDSGGRFAAGVSLVTPLRSVLNERQYIYVLGYESPPGKEGKYRKIKIKCKRKGVTLRYRRGYIGS